MKFSEGFDARRLRPRTPGNWRRRLSALLAALSAALGVSLAVAGAASLLGRAPQLDSLNEAPALAGAVLAAGVLLTWCAFALWRRYRRRLRRANDLSMAPHLMKKRN
ncbi:hypothetical protein [Pseudomonas zhanjiangensis]|uniref:Holin-X, holin superfamily III n=1 Tax=Pseudomonas zhanjiangensis TaxID=3239015 RepID=A0ABV3YVF3_9PSED